MPTYNFMNEQVTTKGTQIDPITGNTFDTGKVVSTAPILSGTTDSSGAYLPNTVVTGKAIAADSLGQPENPITIPTPNYNTNSSDGLISGTESTNKTLNDYIASLTTAPTETDKKQQSILDEITKLTGMDTGQEAYKAEQENTLGVPQLKTQISDLNSQILAGLAELKKDETDFQKQLNDLESRPQQLASVVGSAQQQASRTYALERAAKASTIGLLQARQAALGGQLDTAYALVDRALTAKYKPIEDELRIKEAQLRAIEPTLNREERIRAEALRQMYVDQQTKLEDQKANDKQLQTIAIQAASGGAPSSVVQQALATNDPVKAAGILATYLKGPTESLATGGTTQGTLFKVPTAKELGGAQFYKYPSGPQVYTSNGTQIDLAQFKQLTGQTGVPDAQVNFSGIKELNPTTTTTSGTGDGTTTKYTIASASQEIKDQWAQGYIQGNGKISSTDYKAAKAWWIQQKLSATSFDQTFGYLIDQSSPTWKIDYAYKGN